MTETAKAILIAAGYEFGNATTQVGTKTLTTSGEAIRITAYKSTRRRCIEIEAHPVGITSMTLSFDINPNTIDAESIRVIEERIVRMVYHY